MPAFLTGPLLKLAGIAAVLALIGGLYLGLQHYRAAAAAEAKRADAAELQVATDKADHDRIVAALEQSNTDAAAQAARVVVIRKVIHDAPTTSACAHSPAVRAVLDSLRSAAATAAHALPGAGAAAGVLPAAGAAGAAQH